MGHIVYFAQHPDGKIKIGSCSIFHWMLHSKRLKSEGCAYLGYIDGDRYAKQALARRFKDCQHFNNPLHPTYWFAPSENLMSFIVSNCILDEPPTPWRRVLLIQGVVYFAVAQRGIKIGFTSNFNRRCKQLNAKYPGIVFIGFVPGSREIETKLQDRFIEFNIPKKNGTGRTDWFNHNARLLDFILEQTFESAEDALKHPVGILKGKE